QGGHLHTLVSGPMQFAPSACTGNQSLRSEYHNCDQDDTKNQVSNITEGEARNHLGESIVKGIKDNIQRVRWISRYRIELRKNKQVNRVDRECSNDHTRDTTDASNHHHGQVNHRVTKTKVIR